MEHLRLADGEYRFACIVWDNEPLPSGRLVELSQRELGWKKSTTYTMLKRLCARGLFANEGGRVRALVSREEFAGLQSEQFVAEAFGGSLPQFLAAFTRRRRLSGADIEELRRLIESAGAEQSAGPAAPDTAAAAQNTPGAAPCAPPKEG